jgi:hypothetical protein
LECSNVTKWKGRFTSQKERQRDRVVKKLGKNFWKETKIKEKVGSFLS